MTNANNDVRELEDLLTELEGQGALPVGPYSDEDDAVTQLMDAPLGEQEWMVQITPLDRRMMSTDQIIAELASGNLVKRDMLVWRVGMSDWAPIARMDELVSVVMDAPAPLPSERRPLPLAPLPPPTPVPPPRLGSSTMASPGALSPNGLLSNGAPANGVSNGVLSNGMQSNGMLAKANPANALARAPLPPVPSTPYGASKSLTPVPDVPPPATLPLLNSAFGSPGAPPPPSLSSNFNVPPPAAAPHPPTPPTLRVSTQRPVAVDFSEMEPVRTAPVKVLVGSGLAALAMIVGTVYALSAGGVFDSGPAIAHEPASAASKPSAPIPPSVVAKPVEPAPAAAKPAEEKPTEDKRAEAKAPPADDKAEPVAESEPQTQKVSAKEDMVAAPERKERRLAKSDTVRAEAMKSEPVKADEAKVDEAKVEAAKVEAAKAEAASDGASESTASRAERRLAARRSKRASAEEAPAPRRNKPRAAAVASAGAEENDEAGKGGDTPGSTFNKQAAKTALDDAAAQAKNCQPQGGPRGAGKVQVRYEPNGKVGAVSILTPAFDNTTTGSCVVMVFRRASIPAFTGSPAVVMNKNFEIP
jgi:hypothetical protein